MDLLFKRNKKEMREICEYRLDISLIEIKRIDIT